MRVNASCALALCGMRELPGQQALLTGYSLYCFILNVNVRLGMTAEEVSKLPEVKGQI